MPQSNLAREDVVALADFRYQIRRFLAFSEQTAREAGLEPQRLRAIACKQEPMTPR